MDPNFSSVFIHLNQSLYSNRPNVKETDFEKKKSRMNFQEINRVTITFKKKSQLLKIWDSAGAILLKSQAKKVDFWGSYFEAIVMCCQLKRKYIVQYKTLLKDDLSVSRPALGGMTGTWCPRRIWTTNWWAEAHLV
ncbi:hypothetical protein HAX54_017082, partial [Datura stramonium]|nr:hypothetical protein [Datura stramonium]